MSKGEHRFVGLICSKCEEVRRLCSEKVYGNNSYQYLHKRGWRRDRTRCNAPDRINQHEIDYKRLVPEYKKIHALYEQGLEAKEIASIYKVSKLVILTCLDKFTQDKIDKFKALPKELRLIYNEQLYKEAIKKLK